MYLCMFLVYVHLCMYACAYAYIRVSGSQGPLICRLVCMHVNVQEWGWGTSGETIFLEAMFDQLPSYLYCHVNQIFSASPPRSLGALSPPGCEP